MENLWLRFKSHCLGRKILWLSCLTLGMAVWLSAVNARAQQSASAIYFANDEVRVASLLERKQILEYRVILSGERRFRETFFDTTDLILYQRGMFYRLREAFDGQARLEFYNPSAEKDRPALGPIRSVAIAPDKVLAARGGRIDDQRLLQTQNLGGRDANNVQLVAEYARHRVVLERGGKQEFFVSLLVGSFEGLSGKKLKKSFWALEMEVAAKNLTPAHVRELKRIAETLIPELKLNAEPKNFYSQGVEQAVFLRANERQIYPVRLMGGSKGKAIEQFDMPDAVAFTLDGKLLTGDTDNARFKIYSFDENAQQVRVIGAEGSAPGQFDHSVAATIGSYKIYNQVQGITVDKNGSVYVIDQGNRRLQAFDAEGKILADKVIQLTQCDKENPRCNGGLWRPSKKGEYSSLQGLAADQEGGIFVSDKGMSRVYRLLPGGKMDPAFNLQELDVKTARPILKEPESLAVYQDKLFVANEGSGDIKIFDRRTGKLIGSADGFGADVFAGDVEGLAVAGDYLFTVDVQNSRIAAFDLKTEKPSFLLGFVADFESADGLAVDPTGKYVAVADQGNVRVVLFSLPEILNHLTATKPQR